VRKSYALRVRQLIGRSNVTFSAVFRSLSMRVVLFVLVKGKFLIISNTANSIADWALHELNAANFAHF